MSPNGHDVLTRRRSVIELTWKVFPMYVKARSGMQRQADNLLSAACDLPADI
jgi:hypothetical protein